MTLEATIWQLNLIHKINEPLRERFAHLPGAAYSIKISVLDELVWCRINRRLLIARQQPEHGGAYEPGEDLYII